MKPGYSKGIILNRDKRHDEIVNHDIEHDCWTAERNRRNAPLDSAWLAFSAAQHAKRLKRRR